MSTFKEVSKLAKISLVFTLCFLVNFAAHAADSIGQVKTIDGTATVTRAGQDLMLKVGSPLYQQDVIKTNDAAKVGMTFIDNSMFSVGPNSEISLEKFRFNTTTHKGLFNTNVKRGTLAAVSGKIAKANPGAMTMKTPSAILGVRGTKFLVEVEGE